MYAEDDVSTQLHIMKNMHSDTFGQGHAEETPCWDGVWRRVAGRGADISNSVPSSTTGKVQCYIDQYIIIQG